MTETHGFVHGGHKTVTLRRKTFMSWDTPITLAFYPLTPICSLFRFSEGPLGLSFITRSILVVCSLPPVLAPLCCAEMMLDGVFKPSFTPLLWGAAYETSYSLWGPPTHSLYWELRLKGPAGSQMRFVNWSNTLHLFILYNLIIIVSFLPFVSSFYLCYVCMFFIGNSFCYLQINFDSMSSCEGKINKAVFPICHRGWNPPRKCKKSYSTALPTVSTQDTS